MRKNQIILDEAARGVRRAFIGSIAGSATMLGVIGVAGAYGMPERLSAQSLSTALTSLQIRLTPMVDSAGPIVDRAMVMAAHVAPKPRSVAIESDDEVILQVPRSEAPRFALAAASPTQVVEASRVQAIAAPITPPAESAVADVIALPTPAAAAPVDKPAVAPVKTAAPAPVATPPADPVADVVAMPKSPVASPIEKPVLAPVKTTVRAPAAPVVAPPAEPVMTTAALPAPAIPVPLRPARAMPGAMPNVGNEQPALPAPLVFEQPQLDRIQPLTPLPRLEIVETPKAAAPAAPAEPVPAAAATEQTRSEPAKPAPAKRQLKTELPKSTPEQPTTVAALAVPEVPKAEAIKLEALKLETAKPEAAKPEVAKPEVAKPGVAKPEVAKPEVVKPETLKADTPKLTEPRAETTMSAVAITSDFEMPNPDEYPKAVFVYLPLPKPPMSPAQLLDLQGAEYDKAEKCLAQAIYFEARAEPVRGQQAVAQVVLNRVFSPYYPKDVCSVVYQNAHRHLSCQFTFACDGKPEAIRERGSWARANRIARQALHANFWLPEVAKATHYHATYVSPNWIRDMKVMVKHGVHIFYRPRNWGDGSREAQWATPSAEAAAAPAPTKVALKKGTKS
jgi:spore germination cell wall hydrolase CwlJ-like protein